MEGGNYLQGNLDIMKGQGLAKYVHYNEVSLYQGTFPYILLLVGRRISFLIPRTSLYIGSLNRETKLCLIITLFSLFQNQ